VQAPKQAPQKPEGPNGCALIFLGCFLFFLWFVGNAIQLPVGTHCLLRTKTYGVKDLKESYEAFERAERAKDEFGLAEVTFAGKAAPLAEGVACLVIDTNFWAHFAWYRQIRVLNGVYTGQVFWVRGNDLVEGGPPPPPPAEPRQPTETRPVVRSGLCNYANETRDASGICVCETGYRRDPHTDQCILEK
jgi:hypothetical protein